MTKKLFMLSLVMTMASSVLAQTAKILNVTPKGFVVEMERNKMKNTYLSVNVKLQYSRIADEDAGCGVVMNTAPFPMVTNMDQLYNASQKYDFGSEDLEGSTQQRTVDLDVLVPFEKNKTTGKAQALYLQAIVLQGEESMNLLAKSQVMKVEAKNLTIIDIFQSQEEAQRLQNIFSGAIGVGLDAIADGTCPYCKGKGEVEEKASYMITCYYCEGTGREPS